jgi:hypothetical protein
MGGSNKWRATGWSYYGHGAMASWLYASQAVLLLIEVKSGVTEAQVVWAQQQEFG